MEVSGGAGGVRSLSSCLASGHAHGARASCLERHSCHARTRSLSLSDGEWEAGDRKGRKSLCVCNSNTPLCIHYKSLLEGRAGGGGWGLKGEEAAQPGSAYDLPIWEEERDVSVYVAPLYGRVIYENMSVKEGRIISWEGRMSLCMCAALLYWEGKGRWRRREGEDDLSL